MRLAKYLPLISLLFIVGACDENRVFEKNIDFENKLWHVDSIPQFEFNIEDISAKYNFYYNIRNSVSYPFQNLYITYYLEDSTGNELLSELNDVAIFELKTGQPKGDGLGDIFDQRQLFLDGYHFSAPGIYRIRLEQFMRQEELPDIISIGIRVEKKGEIEK